MPRRVRELVDEGIYHIFNRGNDKMDLFRDEGDFSCFRNKWLELKRRLGTEIYHYCLMTNHFHFLLKVRRARDLTVLMHRVQLGYARYFKGKYDFVGHVFQERFRSPRIAEDSYYLQCGRYIERNPVKAGVVREAAEYPHSSAPFYASGAPDRLITPNLYYAQMGDTPESRQRNYRDFLRADEPYAPMIDAALTKA